MGLPYDFPGRRSGANRAALKILLSRQVRVSTLQHTACYQDVRTTSKYQTNEAWRAHFVIWVLSTSLSEIYYGEILCPTTKSEAIGYTKNIPSTFKAHVDHPKSHRFTAEAPFADRSVGILYNYHLKQPASGIAPMRSASSGGAHARRDITTLETL